MALRAVQLNWIGSITIKQTDGLQNYTYLWYSVQSYKSTIVSFVKGIPGEIYY